MSRGSRAPTSRYRDPSADATCRTSKPTASHRAMSAAALGRTPAASAAAVLASSPAAVPSAMARSEGGSSPSPSPPASAANDSSKRASASAASAAVRAYPLAAAPVLDALPDCSVPGLRRRRPAVRSSILPVTPAASPPARRRLARPPAAPSPASSAADAALLPPRGAAGDPPTERLCGRLPPAVPRARVGPRLDQQPDERGRRLPLPVTIDHRGGHCQVKRRGAPGVRLVNLDGSPGAGGAEEEAGELNLGRLCGGRGECQREDGAGCSQPGAGWNQRRAAAGRPANLSLPTAQALHRRAGGSRAGVSAPARIDGAA
eukprot:scaffold11202_cov93-Isochrysis_galbana.AAC.2